MQNKIWTGNWKIDKLLVQGISLIAGGICMIVIPIVVCVYVLVN